MNGWPKASRKTDEALVAAWAAVNRMMADVRKQSPVDRCQLKVVNLHEVSERGTHKIRKPLAWFLPPTVSHPRAGGFACVVAR